MPADRRTDGQTKRMQRRMCGQVARQLHKYWHGSSNGCDYIPCQTHRVFRSNQGAHELHDVEAQRLNQQGLGLIFLPLS